MAIGFRATTTTTAGGVTKAIGINIAKKTEIANRDLKAAGDRARMVAKRRSPVDTGRLRRSIRVFQRQLPNGNGYFTLQTSVPYARFQEDGFRHYQSGKWVRGKFYMQAGQRAGQAELRKRGYRR